MPKEDKNILKYNHGEKPLNEANAIYFDVQTLPTKNQSAQSNPNQSYTQIKAIREVCGYSMILVTLHCKNIIKTYRGKHAMKKFSEDLRTLSMMVINHEKEEMIPLTYNEQVHHEK